MLDPNLEQFLDRLMKDKFPDGTITDQFIEDSKEELRPLLMKKINLALFEAFSPSDRLEFGKLVEAGTDDAKLQEFFSTHISNPEQIMAESLLAFRRIYLG